MTKIGLDGHDRGSRIVAAACRDAGMEVVYTPPWQAIATVVKFALEEDVDVVGVSSLAADHLIVPGSWRRYATPVSATSPSSSAASFPTTRSGLLESGVRAVFHPGGTLDEIRRRHPSHAGEARAPASWRIPRRTRHEQAGEAPLPLPASTHRRAGDLATRIPRQIGEERADATVSGIPIRPLYTPATRRARASADALGYPGQPDYTRGIYATMHRGRTWTQRQLIGLGTPEDYNARLLDIIAQGATAVSLIPCNSVFRGYDMDAGRCRAARHLRRRGNTAEHMTDASTASIWRDVVRHERSVAVHAACLHARRPRSGAAVDWRAISGTSNQSDYLSHFVANHMFFRLALPGARRVLVDHIAWCNEHVPKWNPMSVVGQHMQQAGATPAEAMAFTLSSPSSTPRTASPAAWSRISSCRASPSSSTSRSASSRRSPSSAPAGASGRAWPASASAPGSARLALQVPRPDLGRRSHAPATAQQHRPRHGAGDRRHLRRSAVAAHRRLRRGVPGAERGGGAHRRGDAEHPARGSAPDRRDRSARRLVLRRVADRRRWKRRSSPS